MLNYEIIIRDYTELQKCYDFFISKGYSCEWEPEDYPDTKKIWVEDNSEINGSSSVLYSIGRIEVTLKEFMSKFNNKRAELRKRIRNDHKLQRNI